MISKQQSDAAMERMTCAELANLIALNNAILDAEIAGDTFYLIGLRATRDAILKTKAGQIMPPIGFETTRN
jgi:hypothetical protein